MVPLTSTPSMYLMMFGCRSVFSLRCADCANLIWNMWGRYDFITWSTISLFKKHVHLELVVSMCYYPFLPLPHFCQWSQTWTQSLPHHLTGDITPQVERKTKIIIVVNEWVKSHQSAHACPCFSFSFLVWEDLLKFATTAGIQLSLKYIWLKR